MVQVRAAQFFLREGGRCGISSTDSFFRWVGEGVHVLVFVAVTFECGSCGVVPRLRETLRSGLLLQEAREWEAQRCWERQAGGGGEGGGVKVAGGRMWELEAGRGRRGAGGGEWELGGEVGSEGGGGGAGCTTY